MTIKNEEKLQELIKECKIRRLATQESLNYIKQNGIKLSERTYRRYKKKFEDGIKERILEEGEKNYESEYLKRLDTTRLLEKEYWNIYSNTENGVLKIKILDSILNIQDTSKEYLKDIRWKVISIKREREKEEKELEREENLKSYENHDPVHDERIPKLKKELKM